MKVQCDKNCRKNVCSCCGHRGGDNQFVGKEPGGVSQGVGRAGIRPVSGH